MNKIHRKRISEGQRKSWAKGGPSRLAFEKRKRAQSTRKLSAVKQQIKRRA